MIHLSPIALFVYNRPWHARQTIEALQDNEFADQSKLIVFSDGPKDSIDRQKIEKVRKYIRNVKGFRSIDIIEHSENLGLADSIISGTTEVTNKYDRIIVLEDDMITSKYFLRFMNEGLNLYQNEKQVVSLHGWVWPNSKSDLPSTFFLRGADCWGWATWKRGWDLFEPDGKKLLDQLKRRRLIKAFDYHVNAGYFKMLRNQVAGKNESWAIRWQASTFLQNKLCPHPNTSLIHNIGNDNSGTHCKLTSLFDVNIATSPIKIYKIPISENSEMRSLAANFYKSLRPSIMEMLLFPLRYIKKKRSGEKVSTGPL